MRYSAMAMLVCVMGVAAGCSITDTAGDLRGIKGVDGDKLTHLNTRNYAIHLFMTKPIWGDATLNNTVQCFADDVHRSPPLNSITISRPTNTNLRRTPTAALRREYPSAIRDANG